MGNTHEQRTRGVVNYRMRTFAEQPDIDARTIHQGLLYRTATGLSNEPRLRTSNAIDYEYRGNESEITHCDVTFETYPTHMTITVTNIAVNGEETHIKIQIIATPTLLYGESYDERGFSYAQFKRVDEPHRTGVRIYDALTPKRVVNIEKNTETTALSPMLLRLVKFFCGQHEEFGYEVTRRISRDECAQDARRYVDEHRLSSTLSAFPTNLFDIEKSKEDDILWDEQDWSAYYDVSVEKGVSVNPVVFRDARPLFLGQVAGDGIERLLGEAMSRVTRKHIEDMLKDDQEARTISQNRSLDDVRQQFEHMVDSIERCIILDTETDYYVNNRGYTKRVERESESDK